MGIVAVVAEGRWRLWGSWRCRGGTRVWQLERRGSCARAHESLRAERVVRRTIADLGSCVVAFERFWTVLNAFFFFFFAAAVYCPP